MRPLNSHFAHDAVPTLDSFMKHAKEARVFRRAQAVREVVAGQTVKAVSDTFHFTNSALRKWVKRFAREGTGGLFDRPRSGTTNRNKIGVSNGCAKGRRSLWDGLP